MNRYRKFIVMFSDDTGYQKEIHVIALDASLVKNLARQQFEKPVNAGLIKVTVKRDYG